MSETNGQCDAHVQVLTAEVRTLMVGSRQVTLSVYNQLDYVPHTRIEPFGRVNPREGGLCVVGRDAATGILVRAHPPSLWDILQKERFTRGVTRILEEAVAAVFSVTDHGDDSSACIKDLARTFSRFTGVGLFGKDRARQMMLNLATRTKLDERLFTTELSIASHDLRTAGQGWDPVRGSADHKAAQLVKGYLVATQTAEGCADAVAKAWSDLPLIILAGLR